MAKQSGFILASIMVVTMLAALIFVYVWRQAHQTVVLWRYHDTQQQEMMVAQSILRQLAGKPVIDGVCDGWQQPINGQSQILWQPYMAGETVPNSWRIETYQDCFCRIDQQYYQRDVVKITVGQHTQRWVVVHLH